MSLIFNIPDEMLNGWDKLAEDVDEMAKEMVSAGADVVISALRPVVPIATFGVSDYGALQKSLKKLKPKITKSGDAICSFRFTGYDKRGVPNAIKAIAHEYGTFKQSKKPFVRPIVSSNEKTIESAMIKVQEKYMRYLP